MMNVRPVGAVNLSVRRGVWGENVATDYLKTSGYQIIDRNVHPCAFDRRLEIDIIAYEPNSETIVFVEVKQHARHVEFERRLRSVNKHKRELLRTACNAWKRRNRWQGGYRFDVIEIYGTPEHAPPEIDHIHHVNLFTPRDRFVRWR